MSRTFIWKPDPPPTGDTISFDLCRKLEDVFGMRIGVDGPLRLDGSSQFLHGALTALRAAGVEDVDELLAALDEYGAVVIEVVR